jgi:hypothetical protein
MGNFGRRMKEVLVSTVTEPAADAAGMLLLGKGEGPAEREGEDEKVLTVLISVLIRKVRMVSI